MNSGKLAGAVLGAILRVVFVIAVVYAVYRGANMCYDYGYRVFTEPAVSPGEGYPVNITITGEESAMELGRLFAARGLSRDARLFALQYLFSEYRKEIKPGTYELTTSMTAGEMFAVMASEKEETDEGGSANETEGAEESGSANETEGANETESAEN